MTERSERQELDLIPSFSSEKHTSLVHVRGHETRIHTHTQVRLRGPGAAGGTCRCGADTEHWRAGFHPDAERAAVQIGDNVS